MPRQKQRLPGPDEWAAECVRDERTRRGWSTAELARRMTEAGCPISQSSVWDIENRKPPRRISIGEAVALARVFGMSIQDLVQPPRDAAAQLSDLRAGISTMNVAAMLALDELEGVAKRELHLMLGTDLAPEVKKSGIEAARSIAAIRDRAEASLSEIKRLVLVNRERGILLEVRDKLQEAPRAHLRRRYEALLKAYEAAQSEPPERSADLLVAAEKFLKEAAAERG